MFLNIGKLIKIYLQNVKKITYPRDLIRFAILKHCNRIALIDGNREISYGKLYDRAKRLSNALLKIGVGKGDKLAILLYNCQEYFEIRIATYLTGIVLVPLVWDTPWEDIIFILRDCQVKALIYHPDVLKNTVEDLREKTPVKIFIPLPYEDFILNMDANVPNIKIEGMDLSSINFSSGTTGKPKGVMLSQNSWMNSFYNYVANISHIKRKREMVMLNMLSFATGGSTPLLLSIFGGVKNIVLSRFDIVESISLISKYNVTTIFLSPSLLISILDYCKYNNIRLTLDSIIVGTEYFPQDKFKEAIDFLGPVITTGYGMAEVLPPLFKLSPDDYMEYGKVKEELLFSVGKPCDNVKIKIVDKAGKEIPIGRVGKIVVKSPTISQGYWNNTELNTKHYKDGWFYTNDYGYIDKEGFLYILGREEDILREDNDEYIFAREMEEVIHKHPLVLEAYVFLGTNKEICVAVALRRGNSGISIDEIIGFCRDNFKKQIVPNIVKIYERLPKNASGKIDRRAIKRDFLGKP